MSIFLESMRDAAIEIFRIDLFVALAQDILRISRINHGLMKSIIG